VGVPRVLKLLLCFYCIHRDDPTFLYNTSLFLVQFLSLATFSVNIPVILVTLRSRHFENDPVAKLVASLAVSDIVNGIITTELLVVNGTHSQQILGRSLLGMCTIYN